jgi:hypothetical protein
MATTSAGLGFDHDPRAAIQDDSDASQSPDEPEQSPEDSQVDFLAGDHDSRWDVFLPDDDEVDPLPEPGDFWLDDD